MTTEEFIIAVIRVLGSLPVLAWPFPGSLLAVLVDLSDLFLRQGLHEGGVRDYQEFDKWLDQVYMLAFLAVALRWSPVPRNIAVALYVYRLAGFVAFEVTQDRDLLLLFPNVFEFWFMFVAGIRFFGVEQPEPAPVTEPPRPGRFAGLLPFRYRPGQVATVLAALIAAKLAQEYILHTGRWLDDFTAFEAVEAAWEFITPPY